MWPYIGVNGFQSLTDAGAALTTCRSLGLVHGTSRIAAIGCAADPRTVRNEAPHSPRKVPSREVLRDIFFHCRSEVATSLHFDLRIRERGNPRGNSLEELRPFYRSLFPGLQNLIEFVDPSLIYSLQLNGIPFIAEVERLKNLFPTIHLIYQLRRESMALPEEILRGELRRLNGIASYILIDASAGEGKVLASSDAIRWLEIIRETCPHAIPAIAGGLSPDNLEKFWNSISANISRGDISIDAESGVRTPLDDSLDIDRVNQFYRAGVRCLAV